MVNNEDMERMTKSFNFAAYHDLETVSTQHTHDIRTMSLLQMSTFLFFTSDLRFYGHPCGKSP